MVDFARDNSGRYVTTGLSPKQFASVFNLILGDRQARRRGKARQLSPSMLKNKSLDDILKLGKKPGGTLFTKDDLKSFEKSRQQVRKQYSNKERGITYAQLISHSRSIDIKRANNNVDDGSGIKNGSFIGLRHNVALVSVAASQRSVHQHHLVEIRFEEWDEKIDDAAGNDIAAQQRMVREMAAGRVSVNCDCGRYQYWYRYIATAGNFTIAPPKEYIYPKIKNPKLEGVACKHIIHALTRMQGAGWQNRLIQSMRKSAAGQHFADDPIKTTEYFSDEEVKQLNRNRKGKTNQGAARAAWEKYQARLDALTNKLHAADKQELVKARKKLLKARTVSQREQTRRANAQAKIVQLKEEREVLKQQLSDSLKLQKQMFIDALVISGKSPAEARRAYAEYIQKKIGNA